MIYSLDIFIINNDQVTLDAIIAEIPLSTDPKVWPDEYSAPTQGIDDLGNSFIHAVVRFNLDADRTVISDAILAVNGMLTNCEVGTRVKHHDCNHKQKPYGRCYETMIFEVV